MRQDRRKLTQDLGYEFNDISLLETALSHRSAQGNNYERKEFLGDSIINFIIAEALYLRYPKATEGELSRYRAAIVCGEALAQVAQDFRLGEYLRLGSGELKSGGFRRASILADAFEAVIAAVYLDAGLEVCKQRILEWFAERIETVQTKANHKDPKSRLQEYLQAHKIALPLYEVKKIEGEPHAQIFHVSCTIQKPTLSAVASAASRRRAEQLAAEMILEQLS